MLEFVFIAFAAVVCLAAGYMLWLRNLVHAAFSLFFLLFAQAGLYVKAGAEFIAIAQLVVYVGGVLLLVLYGVMLTQRRLGPWETPVTGVFQRLPGLVLAATLFAGLLVVFQPQVWEGNAFLGADAGLYPQLPHAGAAEATGLQLLTGWLLPFELAGVLLLVVLIGAAYLSRQHTEPDTP